MLENPKNGQTVYFIENLDTPIIKGQLISNAIREDIIGAATDHPQVVKRYQIDKQYYVDEYGNRLDSYGWGEFNWGVYAPIEKTFATAKEAAVYLKKAEKEQTDEWMEETNTLEGLLNFPLKYAVSGDEPYWFAQQFYKKRIKDFIK